GRRGRLVDGTGLGPRPSAGRSSPGWFIGAREPYGRGHYATPSRVPFGPVVRRRASVRAGRHSRQRRGGGEAPRRHAVLAPERVERAAGARPDLPPPAGPPLPPPPLLPERLPRLPGPA